MKKFLSLLLSLCLLLGALPMQVLALPGSIFPSEGAVKTVTLDDGSLSLQNEYIYMTFRKLWGTYAYLTVAPAAKPDEEGVLIGQTPRCTFITYDQGREKKEGVVTEPIKAEFVTKTPNGSANAIKVEYSLLTALSLIKAKATVYYELVQLKENGASSDTWGVLASVSEICIDKDSMPQDWNRDFNFKWGYSFNCFTATGHTSTLEKPGGPAIKMSRTTVPEGENPQITTESSAFTASVEDLDTKTVPKGYSQWGDKDGVYITEVYTDGYPWANPFVGLSDYYEKAITSVSGKPIRVALAQTVSVVPGDKPLNTWVQCDSYAGRTFEETADPEGYSHFLWGFHDLIKAGAENVPSQPDAVDAAISAKRLAAFAVNGGVTVEYVADDAALQALKKQYGEPVALISGDYESKNGTEFTFTGGAAMLSPSVTATWNKSSGKLVIKKDGTIEHSGVSLNAPSFKFYQPKNGAENDLQISLTKDGFAFQIEPEKNDAIVFVDIPYAAVKLENAKADAAGNLVFSGNIGFRTIFNGAEFSMEKLGYGLNAKNNEFKVNGVKATGSFDTAKLMALELASISGEVNTFKGEESYAFELELNAFDLFETEASLALVRSKKDGSLIPDELWFFVKSSPGIPLVPPVPVGQLNGGGAGFKNLAKTVNGDYFAIPPIKLRGALAGTYMHLIEGTGNVVLGPSEISLKATDVGIVGLGKNAQIIDSFGYSLQLNGQERTYQGKTYKGVYFGGSQELALNLPSKTLDIFTIDNAIKLGAFGGANENKDTVYLGIGANGIVEGKLQIPSSLGIPFLSGLELSRTDINLIVGGQTTFPVTNTNVSEGMKQAFKNVDVYLGAMTGVNAGVFDARVWVLVPQIVQTDFRKGGGWDIETKWLGKLPEWDWSTKGVDPLVQAVAAEDSGEAVPMLLAADPYAAENGGTNTQIIEVNANPGETPYILLAFENTVTEQQIKDALTIKKNNQDIAINWVDDGGQRDPNSAINADTDILKNKNDEQECRMAMLRLSEGGTYEVNTNSLTLVTDKSCGVAITPFESLVLNLNDYQLSGEIKYAETGTEYVLRTYLANAEGGADYLVEEQIVADPENIAVNIPESGTLAPTGEYYVTSFLMTEKETDLDGDGVMEKALAAIDSNQFNSKISYTNTKQPESPAHVNLEAAGNEVMRAEWQQVDNADGYRVTIYQQQNGGWVDTGFGYELSKETTSIDMALTVGGEETAESKNLSANETYKVGVSAYTQTEDGAKYYSAETESSGVFLPEYTPLNLALSVNGKDCTPDENGVYHAYVGGGSNSLAVTCEGADSITVTRMDTETNLTSDGSNTFAIPDFTGTLMLRVNGVKDKDVTSVFLLVSRDTTAPMLTLSAPIFYADRAAGTYQITGTADAGSEILYGENNESVYAAGDGSFAIQGTLEERQDGDALYIRAQDSAGNLSARQLALVARQAETYAVTVTTDGNGTASADLAAAVAGTNISLSATPNTGYHFKEWQVVSGGVTIENDKFTMPDGNVEIKAIFEKDAAPATPAPTATAKPSSSQTPAPTATAKPNSSPTPAPAATAKPNSGATPAPAATAKPNSGVTPAPAATAKPNSSPTPAPAATAKPESSPAPAPAATAKPESSPAPAAKPPVWWVILPIAGGIALAGGFMIFKKKRRR